MRTAPADPGQLTVVQLTPLPGATTRMVVQVWGERGRSAAPLLTREFPHFWTIFWSDKWED